MAFDLPQDAGWPRVCSAKFVCFSVFAYSLSQITIESKHGPINYCLELKMFCSSKNSIDYISAFYILLDSATVRAFKIVVNTYWLQTWMNDFATWSPEKYGGITMVVLPYSSFWIPDIVLRNK
jgi:hypothetical protein